MKVSIAMATYNGAKYLQDQLTSFLAQTRMPDELVISDDCSTDDTIGIIRKFADKAPFDVKYWRNKKNVGFTRNFNAALLKATGDLVFLSDQDDVWFPEKIAVMTKLAEENPHALVLMNDAELTDAELRSLHFSRRNQLASLGLDDTSFTMGCCMLVRRTLLSMALPIPATFGSHDIWLVSISDALDSRIINKEVLQFYRRHGSNVSEGKSTVLKRYHRIALLKHKLKILLKKKNNNLSSQIYRWTEYIDAAKSVADNCDITDKQKILKHIEKKNVLVSALKKRKELRAMPRTNRVLHGVKFWREGGYKHFRGFSSLIRDISL